MQEKEYPIVNANNNIHANENIPDLVEKVYKPKATVKNILLIVDKNNCVQKFDYVLSNCKSTIKVLKNQLGDAPLLTTQALLPKLSDFNAIEACIGETMNPMAIRSVKATLSKFPKQEVFIMIDNALLMSDLIDTNIRIFKITIDKVCEVHGQAPKFKFGSFDSFVLDSGLTGNATKHTVEYIFPSANPKNGKSKAKLSKHKKRRR